MAVPTAEEQAREQQAGLLKAIAEQGSRGATFYAQQADQAQAQKQAAVSAALDRADTQGGPGSTGAPAALRTQLGAQAAAVGDARANDVAAATTNYSQDQAALTSANDTYMNQLHDAIPLVRTRAEEAAAEQQRQLAMQKQLADLELERSKISLQQSQLGLQGQRESNAAARQSAANGGTPSVAQQKYDAQTQAAQAQDAHRQSVVAMASGAAPSVRSAFSAIVNSNDNLNDALADLEAGVGEGVAFTPWGKVPLGPIFKEFGADLDLNVLTSLVQAFFSDGDVTGAPFPGGSGSSGGGGGVARRG